MLIHQAEPPGKHLILNPAAAQQKAQTYCPTQQQEEKELQQMVDPTELWSSHIQSGVTWKDRRYWDKLNPRRGFQAPLGSFLVAWKTVQVWRLKELISPLGDSVSPEGVCVAVEETRKSCIRSGPCSGLHGHLTATRLWVQTSWSMSPFYVVCMFYHSSNTYFFFNLNCRF